MMEHLRRGARWLRARDADTGLVEGLLVGIFASILLIVDRHLTAPTWHPTGSDWDLWYASAVALTEDMTYPSTRWPLYGMVTAVIDQLVPGPLHRDAMLVSLTATGLAGGGLYCLVRPLFGRVLALVGVSLVLAQPWVREHAAWIGAYALWAMCGVMTVVALRRAAAGSTRAWWWVGGLVAADFAVLEKGVLLGGALLVLTFGTWVAVSRRWRDLGRAAVPFMALALMYVVFPYDLASLDTMATLDVTPGAPPVPGGAQTLNPDAGGYVFGRSMGPVTLWNTALLLASRPPAGIEVGLARLQQAMPGVGQESVVLLAVGASVAAGWALVMGFFRRPDTVSWLGLLILLVTGLPALRSSLEIRFLLPSLLVAPLLALAPLGLVPGRLRLLSLGLLPLVLWSGSPWAGSPWRTSLRELNHADVLDRFAARVWYDVARDHPDAVIDVSSPRKGGLLLIAGRGGRILPSPDLLGETLDPDHLLVVFSPRANVIPGQTGDTLGLATGGPPLGRRRVLNTWTTPMTPGTLVLLSAEGG